MSQDSKTCMWEEVGERRTLKAIKAQKRHNVVQETSPERYLFFSCERVHVEHLEQH